MRLRTTLFAILGTALVLSGASAAEFDWAPLAEEGTVEILTVDEDGETRETKVWVVVLDDAAWMRTNDSRWLANLRRDPACRVRVQERELPLRATEVGDPETYDRVEQAFKDKYGFVQKVMSLFRMSTPTVLRLDPQSES